mmetsp:Transcript_20539/g.50655  ORF Transcript_20539/g.50655 Transcript_20539/m.50655 type:complete len:212 (-) Transcript_20539:1120-1755(-)
MARHRALGSSIREDSRMPYFLSTRHVHVTNSLQYRMGHALLWSPSEKKNKSATRALSFNVVVHGRMVKVAVAPNPSELCVSFKFLQHIPILPGQTMCTVSFCLHLRHLEGRLWRWSNNCDRAAGDLSRGSPETLRNLVVLRQLEDVGFKLENSADVIAELIVCFVIFQQVSRRHKFLGKKTIQGSSLIRTDNMNLPRTGGGDVEMNVREVM